MAGASQNSLHRKQLDTMIHQIPVILKNKHLDTLEIQ